MPTAARRRCFPSTPISCRSTARRSPRPAGGRSRRKPNGPLPPPSQIDPGEPRAQFYLGLAALQKEDRNGALARWQALEAASPEGAEWLPMLRRRIASLAPSGTAEAETEPPPGPTREDIAAARQMLPEERAQMIRGMVEQLALRLKEEPDDTEGWARLARSWRVLGEPEKERDALAALARLLPEASPERAGIDRRIEALREKK